MNKKLLNIFLAAIMMGSFTLVSNMHIDRVQASQNVIGIISSDTTWTKTNSPYILTGPVKVDNGVTLTIEAGATVNLNNYYIQVDGTLQARGNTADQTRFNDGRIEFTKNSNGWNEQSGTGNIFENNILNNVTISATGVGVKFTQNSLSGEIGVGGTSIVTGNIVVGSIGAGGSTIVSKNTVTGAIDGGGDSTREKYPIISSNIVTGGGGYTRRGIGIQGYARVVDNIVSDCNYGIFINTGRDIMGGVILPNAVVERNKVTDCIHGIHAEIYTGTSPGTGKPAVKSNTISQNNIGVYVDGQSQYLTLKNNNVEESSEYSFYLESGSDVDATSNWWGTTDVNKINQTIRDSKNDFNLGKVTFVPFLTQPNLEAEPDPNALPQATPTPPASPALTPSPSEEPQQTGNLTPIMGVAIVAVVIGAGLGLLIYLIKRK